MHLGILLYSKKSGEFKIKHMHWTFFCFGVFLWHRTIIFWPACWQEDDRKFSTLLISVCRWCGFLFFRATADYLSKKINDTSGLFSKKVGEMLSSQRRWWKWWGRLSNVNLYLLQDRDGLFHQLQLQTERKEGEHPVWQKAVVLFIALDGKNVNNWREIQTDQEQDYFHFITDTTILDPISPSALHWGPTEQFR